MGIDFIVLFVLVGEEILLWKEMYFESNLIENTHMRSHCRAIRAVWPRLCSCILSYVIVFLCYLCLCNCVIVCFVFLCLATALVFLCNCV